MFSFFLPHHSDQQASEEACKDNADRRYPCESSQNKSGASNDQSGEIRPCLEQRDTQGLHVPQAIDDQHDTCYSDETGDDGAKQIKDALETRMVAMCRPKPSEQVDTEDRGKADRDCTTEGADDRQQDAAFGIR
jgi:hypothetical protein